MLLSVLTTLWFGLWVSPAFAGVPTRMPKDTVKGRTLFEDHCWQCHGPEGRGDGPLATAFADAALDLRGRPELVWPDLVAIIQGGRGDMPAFAEVMDDHDSRRILVWLAALDGDELGKDERPTRVLDDDLADPADAADPAGDGAATSPKGDTPPTPDVSTEPAG